MSDVGAGGLPTMKPCSCSGLHIGHQMLLVRIERQLSHPFVGRH